MDSHQAHIIEYSGTVELQILIRIQLWELTSLFLEEYTCFLRSSSNEGMLRYTNISLALLYFGTPNSFLKLLLCAIPKAFNAVLVQSMTMTMTMTMITDLLNIIVAMNCYERAQALHSI